MRGSTINRFSLKGIMKGFNSSSGDQLPSITSPSFPQEVESSIKSISNISPELFWKAPKDLSTLTQLLEPTLIPP